MGLEQSWGSSSHVPSQPTEHEARRRDLDKGLTRLRTALIVLGKSALSIQLGETSLHHPAARLNAEFPPARCALDDFQRPFSLSLTTLGRLLVSVRDTCPDLLSRGRKNNSPPGSLRAPTGSWTLACVL
jgi:hypothetical protein